METSRRDFIKGGIVALGVLPELLVNNNLSNADSDRTPIRRDDGGRLDFSFFSSGRGRTLHDYPGIAYNTGVGTKVVAPARGVVWGILNEDVDGMRLRRLYIDHGYRLFSYFSNYFQIDASDLQDVERGDLIGLSGAQFYKGMGFRSYGSYYWAVAKNEIALDPEKVGKGGESPVKWDRASNLDTISRGEKPYYRDLIDDVVANYKSGNAEDPLKLKSIRPFRKEFIPMSKIELLVTANHRMFSVGTVEMVRDRVSRLSQNRAVIFSEPFWSNVNPASTGKGNHSVLAITADLEKIVAASPQLCGGAEVAGFISMRNKSGERLLVVAPVMR